MPNTAARVGSINVLLSTSLGGAVTGLNAFAGHVERTGTRVAGTVAGIDRSVGGLNRTMASISPRGLQNLTVNALRARTGLDQLRGLALAASAALAGILPAGIAAGFVQVADRAHRMENSLKTVTSGAADLKNIQEELFQVSQRSRSSFESTVTLYARTARATEHLGLSQAKLLKITETVQKAFAIGGASPQEVQGAAIQLSQGIASDRFSGEEFRSVAENAPTLLRAIADNIKNTDGSIGVTIGRLRELAHAGALTGKVVTDAIADGAAEIEASFAKTSSTIMQAVQMVDNELLKFVSNSSSASAASSALVSILKVLGDNVENIATILLLLAARWGAAFVGRNASAIVSRANDMKMLRVETLKAAEAAQIAAQAEAKATATRLAGAKAQWMMVSPGAHQFGAGSASEATRARASKELLSANIANLAAQKNLTVATKAFAAATYGASYGGMALAAAGRAASAAWAFMGGGLGVALLALGGAMYLVSRQAQAAEERSGRYADAIKMAGENSAYAAGGIRQAAAELAGVVKYASEAARIVAYQQAVKDLDAALASMASSARTAALVGASFSGELQRISDALAAGTMSAEEAKTALDAVARNNPSFAGVILGFQKSAQEADAARGTMEELDRQIDRLDGRQANITVTIGTRRVELTDEGVGTKGDRLAQPLSSEAFNSRAGGRYADPWKEIFPDLYKKKGGGGPRKTGDDRVANAIQSVRDRIAAMAEEQAALKLNHYEQEKRKVALELEQTALEKVREEARKKGMQDWQNAQLSSAQVAEIDAVSAAYARQAADLKYAKESHEALNEAAGATGGILRGIADGSLEVEDAIMQLIPVVLKLINSMNVASGGKGIFGGGWLQSLIGGFFGVSFHSGGTVGAGGNVVQFPTGAPYAGKFHKGGNFGGRRTQHDEVMALVKKNENIFTAGHTDRIVGALGAATAGMREQRAPAIRVYVDQDGNWHAAVERIASVPAAKAAAKVASKVPAMIGAAKDSEWRRLRPAGAV